MSTAEVIVVVVGSLLALSMVCLTVLLGMDIAAQRAQPVLLPPPPPQEISTGTPVVINTINSGGVRGVVLKCDPDAYELGGAAYLDGEVKREIGGTVRIPRSNVSWVQDLTAVEGNGSR